MDPCPRGICEPALQLWGQTLSAEKLSLTGDFDGTDAITQLLIFRPSLS